MAGATPQIRGGILDQRADAKNIMTHRKASADLIFHDILELCFPSSFRIVKISSDSKNRDNYQLFEVIHSYSGAVQVKNLFWTDSP